MPDPSPLAIDAQHLHKEYRTSLGFWRRRTQVTLAVEDISFQVAAGELFGLLGPNGAGKTTTVKMLTTLLLPTAGRASVLGFDVVRETSRLRPHIGFTFGGSRGLYSRLSGLDNLKYFAELYALDPAFTRRRIPELLELVGLAGREHERVETYSTGMQQRLHLARCLLPDPQVLFLDEPTIGIDPVGSRQLRRIVKDLLGLGKTVLLTTHYMYEAEELCDRIAIINHGRIVAQDTPAGLKRAAGADTLIDIQAREAPAALLEQLARMGLAVEVQPAHTGSGTRVLVRTPDPGCAVETLAPFLKDERIQGWEVRRPSLEDVYVSIIQEEEHV